MKKLFTKGRSLFILCLFVILVVLFILYGGRYLVVDEEPREADVIIVLSGDEGRVEKAVELYKAGYSEYIILTRANEKGTLVIDAIQSGVPRSALIIEDDASSTYTNATFSKEIMEQRGFRSAIVISSDYHTRRVKLTFDRVFRGSDMELTFVPAESKHFSRERWWNTGRSVQITLKEYGSLVGYYLHLYRWLDIDHGDFYHRP